MAASDFADALLDEFGEAVIYLPAAGGPRAITAIVQRGQVQREGAAPYGFGPALSIQVANDVVDGITADELNTGGDQVTIPVKLGDTATDRRLTNLENNDDDMIEIEVR